MPAGIIPCHQRTEPLAPGQTSRRGLSAEPVNCLRSDYRTALPIQFAAAYCLSLPLSHSLGEMLYLIKLFTRVLLNKARTFLPRAGTGDTGFCFQQEGTRSGYCMCQHGILSSHGYRYQSVSTYNSSVVALKLQLLLHLGSLGNQLLLSHGIISMW